MSFILDALKKSEIERQRQSQPGLMDTPAAQRRSRLPLWAMLLGALLTINIVVLSVMLMRNGALGVAPPPLKRHVDAAAVAADKAPAIADHFSPLDQAPVYAPEIPVPADGASTGNGPTVVAPLVTSPSSGRRSGPRSALRRPDPVLLDEAANAGNEEVLPTINELSLSGAQTLPELHLDVHVYATTPADRFVYINMRKYHEGASLPEGAVVEHIRRDGVVLNYQGLRFILPRQS
ncbi:MAG TPA: general secretion pathway protein GspB [Steroidobacteraceae bacterium]|jgi:general secretion pathway protein B|nr:general secretion pathway protein GspB [Steroidobacteraceae bacterium]